MGTVHPFPLSNTASQTGFDRTELKRIMDLYGRMVSAGQWKDYAVEFRNDAAVFWAFRRTAERPEYKIEKRPALRAKQGMWALIGEQGMVLKRGHELGPVEADLARIVRWRKRVNGTHQARPRSCSRALAASRSSVSSANLFLNCSTSQLRISSFCVAGSYISLYGVP